jgi:hypothetical protein
MPLLNLCRGLTKLPDALVVQHPCYEEKHGRMGQRHRAEHKQIHARPIHNKRSLASCNQPAFYKLAFVITVLKDYRMASAKRNAIQQLYYIRQQSARGSRSCEGISQSGDHRDNVSDPSEPTS